MGIHPFSFIGGQNMTVLNLVKQLQLKGYKVTYYKRKDGGILIRSINGQKFTAAKGNVHARQILGVEISQRRKSQLTKITKARPWYKTHIIETPEDLESFRKSVMRKWKKAGLRGSISKVNLKHMIADRGIEGAKQYLIEMERHTEGKAYYSQVEALIARIEQDINAVSGDPEEVNWLLELKALIENRKEEFKVEWIFAIFDELYEWENPSNTTYSAHDLFIKVQSLLS